MSQTADISLHRIHPLPRSHDKPHTHHSSAVWEVKQKPGLAVVRVDADNPFDDLPGDGDGLRPGVLPGTMN